MYFNWDSTRTMWSRGETRLKDRKKQEKRNMEISIFVSPPSPRFIPSPSQLGRDVWEGEEKRGTSIPFPGEKAKKKKENGGKCCHWCEEGKKGMKILRRKKRRENKRGGGVRDILVLFSFSSLFRDLELSLTWNSQWKREGKTKQCRIIFWTGEKTSGGRKN